MQAHGEDLVWTNGSIGRSTVDDVIEAPRVLVPENPVEGPAGKRRQAGIFLSPFPVAEARCEVFHDAQGVIPERLDLNRLSAARGHHPVANPGVHPGELRARRASIEQTVFRNLDIRNRNF